MATEPKPKSVRKVVNVGKFSELTEEEQDKILDALIDGIDEEASTETADEDPEKKSE
jgi:hypothetical protein